MKLFPLVLALAVTSALAGKEEAYNKAMQNDEVYRSSQNPLTLLSELLPLKAGRWGANEIEGPLQECQQKQKTQDHLLLVCKFGSSRGYFHATPVDGKWIIYSTTIYEPVGIRRWDPTLVAYPQAQESVLSNLCWAVPHLNKTVARSECEEGVKASYPTFYKKASVLTYDVGNSVDALRIMQATIAVLPEGFKEGFYVQVSYIDFK